MIARRTLRSLRSPLALLYTVFFVVFLYTFLHEGGHALVALLCGAQLRGLSIGLLTLGARADVAGNLSRAQWAAVSVAGVTTPLLLWAAMMLSVPRRGSPLLELFKTVSAIGVLTTLLSWVLLPLLYRAGYALPGDDVTLFLRFSGADPLWTAGLFAAAYIAGWGLFLRRIAGVRSQAALLLSGQEFFSEGTPGVLWAMVAGGVLMAVVAAVLS